MNAPVLSPSCRLRLLPFTEGAERAGVKAFTVYNHMLLPTVFRSVEEDCRHLKTHVQHWDISCERQVEMRGPDAGRLMLMLTPRDLSAVVAGMLAEDHYWISIADSDLLYWVKGIAFDYRPDVLVDEPDISPLGVPGPKADVLMARVFGEDVTKLRFFRFAGFELQGHSLAVARSGYARQGGFEIYVEGGDIGMSLWKALMEAGADLEVRAGSPNMIERIEGGLLSYGNDMTRANTPYECGLGRFCNTRSAVGCVGCDALLCVAGTGPIRQIRPLKTSGAPVPHCGARVGQVTSAAWSPDFETNVAIGMIAMTHWRPGTQLTPKAPDGARPVSVREKFFTH